MATLSKGNLFPEVLVTEMFNKVTGKSSLAKLSGQSPIPFNGIKEFVFDLDKEADIVAENGAKSVGGGTVTAKTINPIKFEYGMRVSDEFLYASEEAKMDVLKRFAEGAAKKFARALDIAAIHGVNPRTKTASTVVGANCFTTAVTQKATAAATTLTDSDVETAIALVQANEYDVSGMAMSPTLRSDLAKEKKTNGETLHPELAWGAQPGSINGLPVDVNSTVSFNSSDLRGIVGDFENAFKWGYAKEIPLEVISYGNPDNDTTAGDLKGHNQVYLRAEVYIGWAILNENSFALLNAKAA